MAEKERGIFREKSLERLSSPERLDQLLRIVDRRSWMPLLALGAIVALLVGWALIGTIPINVHGRGILLRPRMIAEIQAPAAGYLVELYCEAGESVSVGQVLGRIDQPDLRKQLELQREKVRQFVETGREMLLLQRDGLAQAMPDLGEHDLDDVVAAARVLARHLRETELRVMEEQREQLESRVRLAGALPEALRKRWQSQKSLASQGVISEEQRVDAESSYLESLSQVSDLETQLRALRTRELEVEERYLDRLLRIAEREQQIADARREVERIDERIERETRIRAENGGRILECSAAVGQYLEPGARIGSMRLSDEVDPGVAVAYFSVGDGKRLKAGDAVEVTPDTVQREHHGSIRGEVVSVSAFPVTLEEASRVIGNRGLAESLISGGNLIQVEARLRGAATFSGYDWTHGRGPEMAFSNGTTTIVRAAVERRRPIDFVLPFARKTAGVD